MLIYHVDDSVIAHRVLANMLKGLLPAAELKQFTSVKAIIEALTTASELPSLILSDQSMPSMDGMEFLQWAKRHPRFHTIPFAMVTAEVEDHKRSLAKKFGCIGYVLKPVEAEELAPILDKIQKLPKLSNQETRELDLSFSEELVDLTEELFELVNQLNDTNFQRAYQIFHTIKGSSSSLQFYVMADFVHQIESFLNAIKTGKLFNFPKVRELLNEAVADLEGQADKIKIGDLMSPTPSRIIDGMALIRANVEAGWKIGESTHSENNEKTAPESSKVLSRTVNSVRIKNESLNHLQAEFKKILQLRTRLNTFSNSLKQEFHDEHFPKELAKMIDDLGATSSGIMEFFISLRVVSANRLRHFCTQAAQQNSSMLNKSVSLDFVCDENLEIDQAVLENLEGMLTHLIKNSLDHGIEDGPIRSQRKKDPLGKVQIQIAPDSKDQLKITLSDDGGGIDSQKLKEAILKKGLITADTIERMKPEQVVDLIFVDGLSTKDNVSDISGRGVGMAAVKEMTTQMGGTIAVQSIVGQGTTFTLILPRYFRL